MSIRNLREREREREATTIKIEKKMGKEKKFSVY